MRKLFLLFTVLMFSLLPLSANDIITSPESMAEEVNTILDAGFVDTTALVDTVVALDSLSLGIPAFATYSFSWNHDRVNPYRVAIDSMPDSIHIDVSDFVYPALDTRITSKFGYRRGRYHYGVDVDVHYRDTIRATFSGRVRIVDYEGRGYGHYVLVRHDNGLETLMAHLSKVLVKIDQDVKAGDVIGLGGNTGRSTGSHLHYEMRYLGNAFNPEKLIDFSTKSLRVEQDSCYVLSHAGTYSHNKELKQLAQAAYHRVRSGDTLSHIARRYGTSVRRLCSLNGIRETSILQIGQRIRYR